MTRLAFGISFGSGPVRPRTPRTPPPRRRATLARIDAALHAAGFDLAAGALEDFLDECVAARLVHRDGAHYLALALPPRRDAVHQPGPALGLR